MGLVRVGFDGSPSAAAALRWGVDAARWSGHDVEALLVGPDGPADVALRMGLEGHVEALASSVCGGTLDVEVRTEVTTGAVVSGLVEAEPTADLLVVGTRGRGVLAGLLGGSVSERVMERTHGPVAIVGEEHRDPTVGRIVVGVDASGQATRALRWAVDQARLRGAVIEVVSSHRPVVVPAGAPWIPGPVLVDPVDSEQLARTVLEEQLDRVDTRGVDLLWSVIEAAPHDALCGRAEDADLLVIGTRGLGAIGGLVLGSTGHRCLHEATAPLVVVP